MKHDDAKTVINNRGHGRNFTIVANSVMEDLRLKPDERLVLCWLLGRPEDWVIIPAQVQSSLGSDAITSIAS